MIPAPVRYVRASSLDEAIDLLAEPDSQALAGGQSLVPLMKLRLARPSLLVDIGRLGPGSLEVADDELRLGALMTWDELADAAELGRPALAAIAECASSIGDLQVRNRGTLGGSLSHADPASDMPAVMLAFGAGLRLRSPEGEREIPAADFFLGPFATALRRQELLTHVVVGLPPPGSGSAYVSVEHPASGFAVVGAAALVLPDGSRNVALTGVGGRPVTLPRDSEPVNALASVEVLGDRYAPSEYRRRLAEVVVLRALDRAQSRALEDSRWPT